MTRPTRGTSERWLEAAYAALVAGGVEAVRVAPLSDALGLSRTSFYGHFDSREALLDALLDRWRAKNTGNLIARTEAYAESVGEALFNLFDCWIDPALFDADFDRAVRHWALADAATKAAVEEADRQRIDAIAALFERFGRSPEVARIRAYAVYYTQIGYIAMMVREAIPDRIDRMPLYIETFAGEPPSAGEIARFRARHLG